MDRIEEIKKENGDPWLSVHCSRSNTNYLLEQLAQVTNDREALCGALDDLKRALRVVQDNYKACAKERDEARGHIAKAKEIITWEDFQEWLDAYEEKGGG